jgi:hypothetical protein
MAGMRRPVTSFDIVTAAAMAAVLLLMTPLAAFAYIDPGAGSVAYQMVLGTVLAATFLFRSVLGKIRKWFEPRDRP